MAQNIPAGNGGTAVTLAPVGPSDRIFGNPQAKVAVVMYEDFQCPFCEKFFTESETNIRNTYVQNGDVQLVYRDFAFLGPESNRAAEAARCAADQGKFWEYHDYLFTHQNGENEGNFADQYLKSFAKNLGLNTNDFDSCLDGGKYVQAVTDQTSEGSAAGVSGTPKGFILKDGQITDTIDGAEPFATVKAKIDAALK
jgi:protein-disulfide isomerase